MPDKHPGKQIGYEASRIAFRMIVHQMDKIAEHVSDPERRWQLLREALRLIEKKAHHAP